MMVDGGGRNKRTLMVRPALYIFVRPGRAG